MMKKALILVPIFLLAFLMFAVPKTVEKTDGTAEAKASKCVIGPPRVPASAEFYCEVTNEPRTEWAWGDHAYCCEYCYVVEASLGAECVDNVDVPGGDYCFQYALLVCS